MAHIAGLLGKCSYRNRLLVKLIYCITVLFQEIKDNQRKKNNLVSSERLMHFYAISFIPQKEIVRYFVIFFIQQMTMAAFGVHVSWIIDPYLTSIFSRVGSNVRYIMLTLICLELCFFHTAHWKWVVLFFFKKNHVLIAIILVSFRHYFCDARSPLFLSSTSLHSQILTADEDSQLFIFEPILEMSLSNYPY